MTETTPENVNASIENPHVVLERDVAREHQRLCAETGNHDFNEDGVCKYCGLDPNAPVHDPEPEQPAEEQPTEEAPAEEPTPTEEAPDAEPAADEPAPTKSRKR